MSLILDALKKLEREKALNRSGPVDIVPEIINSRNKRARSGNWKIPVALIGVAALTAVATIVIMIATAPHDRQPVPLASGNADSPQPVPRFSASRVQAGEKAMAGSNVRHKLTGGIPAAEASRNPSFPHEDADSRIPSHSTKVRMEKSDDLVRNGGGQFPALKVAGIAWQDDKADRRAVVNGALAGEGAVIEGARIVRIYPDRVRFSCGGQTFEIAIAGPTQAK